MVEEYHFVGCETKHYDSNLSASWRTTHARRRRQQFLLKKWWIPTSLHDVTTQKTVLLVTTVRTSNLTMIMLVTLTITWIILYTLSAIFAVEQRLTGYCPSGTMLISTVEIICFPDQHVTGFRITGGKSFMLPTLSLNAWYTSCWYSSL